VRAPFDGVVTSRSTQIGALIVAGNAASTPLFTVSDVRRMRVFVRVPQSASAGLAKGLHANLTLPEYPGRRFDAVLARSAGAVDPQSGTVLMELDAGNRDGALKPGAYAQVHFPLAATGAFTIPSSALVANGAGTSVATVGAKDRVAFRPVTVTRDDGAVVEIGAGLTGTERVIDTPPDALRNGDAVHVQSAGRR
jgi:RND family efflux transporter MFP subunit